MSYRTVIAYPYVGGYNTAPLAGTAVAVPTTRTSSSDQSGSRLSTGVKAGIGVGVSLGVVFVVLVGLFYFLRRRRRDGTQNSEISSDKDAD